MKYILSLLVCLGLLSCSRSIPVADQGTQPTTPVKNEPVRKARNVILLIGDGMGLSQITGGMYFNGNKTALERLPVVGLHKCHSLDNLVTDSAAGATAFACGVKTFNGAVGVDGTGQPVQTILEEAEERGLATGLVATSSIVHATPASFIAHVVNRREYEQIALQFLETDIDLFIGGGKSFFDRREDGRNLYDALRRKGYYITDYFETPFNDVFVQERKNFGYLTADKEPLPASGGRDYLIPATQFSLKFLEERGRRGFFLMIEGSQIDWGGHANDPDYVISEFVEFDAVIDICYNFARRDGETLLIVTADHETGGFAINPESTMDDLNVSFTTGGHTASMIPVFAYGPGSERFAGIYDNTEIYSKMRKAYGWR
ncbi:MAG: alkaline phosphatase [Saprospiraceae bacterium]|nr:alkaline phosphatase [Saprospiraceae bacterium]